MFRNLHHSIGVVSSLGIAGLVFSFSGGSAQATTCTTPGVGTCYAVTAGGSLEDVGVTVYTASGNLSGSHVSGYAGQDTVLIASQSIAAYCVDVFHFINTGSHNYSYANNTQVTTSSGYKITGSSSQVRWTSAQVAELTALLASAPATTDIETAALQIAIWEVEYDNGLSYTVGNTSLQASGGMLSVSWSSNSALKTQVVNDLALAYSNPPAPNGKLYELTDASPIDSTSNQSLIYYIPGTIGGGSSPSPEPATLGLLGGGVAALWAARRRKHA